MENWQTRVIEVFPEFGDAISTWSLIDLAANLGMLLERAVSSEDNDTCERIITFLLWAERQGSTDEQFTHLCIDVIRLTFQRQKARSVLARHFNNRRLAQFRGIIEYVTSRDMFTQFSDEVRFAKQKSKRAR
jgi:hypothetical protein